MNGGSLLNMLSAMFVWGECNGPMTGRVTTVGVSHLGFGLEWSNERAANMTELGCESGSVSRFSVRVQRVGWWPQFVDSEVWRLKVKFEEYIAMEIAWLQLSR